MPSSLSIKLNKSQSNNAFKMICVWMPNILHKALTMNNNAFALESDIPLLGFHERKKQKWFQQIEMERLSEEFFSMIWDLEILI